MLVSADVDRAGASDDTLQDVLEARAWRLLQPICRTRHGLRQADDVPKVHRRPDHDRVARSRGGTLVLAGLPPPVRSVLSGAGSLDRLAPTACSTPWEGLQPVGLMTRDERLGRLPR